MRVWFSVFIVMLIVFSGCENLKKKVAPPPPPEPVGPQTKQEVYALISPSINPLRNVVSQNTMGLSDFDREQVMTSLRNAVVNYGSLSFGQEAIKELGYEIMEIARQAGQQNRYKVVLTCIDAIELLSMESQLLKRLGARADVILQRPVVEIHGFLDDHEKGDTYVFLNIINRQTGEVEKIEARTGDEFNNLRFVRILGNNQGILLEYLRMPGLFFEIEAFQ